MKYIELSQDKRALVDDDLHQHLSQWKWYYRKRSGTRQGGDAVRTLHGYDKDGHTQTKTLYMVSLIQPTPPGFMVDHKDCNPLNNQRSNLRLATNKNNIINSKARTNNKTGVKGVYWHEAKQRFVVQLSVDGKKKWIGDFKTLPEAAKASEAAIKKYHGVFAKF